MEKLHNSERSENDTDRKILEVRKSIRKVLRYDEVYIPRNSLCVGRARFQMLQSKGIVMGEKREAADHEKHDGAYHDKCYNLRWHMILLLISTP